MTDQPKPEQKKKKGKKGKQITDQDIISGYVQKEGDYRIKIRIIEAQDLIPRGGLFKGGSANPYVVVDVMGKKKATRYKKKTLNPIFNETFIYNFLNLKKAQYTSGMIKFTVKDSSYIVDDIIGMYEIDITAIYFSLHHKKSHVFLPLQDPTDEKEGCQGFLKVSMEVMGPGDEPVEDDPKALEKKKAKGENNQLDNPKIKQTGHLISVEVYRGDQFPPLDLIGQDITAFTAAKYSGISQQTKNVSSRCPDWNQRLDVPAMFPNHSKFTLIEVWDYHLTASNVLVGCFRIPINSFKNKSVGPKWGNLYGPPLSGTGEFAEYMELYGQEKGSHWRGRVLYKISSKNEKEPKALVENLDFKFPQNPPPNPPHKTYTVRIDIFEGVDLPDRDQAQIHVGIGPYILKTSMKEINNLRSVFYEQIEDKKCSLPSDPDDIPDLIFYFADEEAEDRRHSFCRIKAKQFINPTEVKPILIKLKEDRTLNLIEEDEFPGIIFAQIELYTGKPPERPQLAYYTLEQETWILRVHLFIGRDLPPSDSSGTSDPFVRVRCLGKTAESQIMSGTLNPAWYQTLELEVEFPIYEKNPPPKGFSVMVYDDDDSGKADLIGRNWIDIDEESKIKYRAADDQEFEIIHQRPKWFPIIFDAADSAMGKLLMGYTMIRKEEAENIPNESIYPYHIKDTLHIFCIGVRDINVEDDKEPIFCRVKFDVSGDDNNATLTQKLKNDNCGININQYLAIQVDIPYNRELCPLLDVFLFGYTYGKQNANLLGVATIKLEEFLKIYYEKGRLVDDFEEIMKELEAAGNLGQNDDDVAIPDEIPVLEEENIIDDDELTTKPAPNLNNIFKNLILSKSVQDFGNGDDKIQQQESEARNLLGEDRQGNQLEQLNNNELNDQEEIVINIQNQNISPEIGEVNNLQTEQSQINPENANKNQNIQSLTKSKVAKELKGSKAMTQGQTTGKPQPLNQKLEVVEPGIIADKIKQGFFLSPLKGVINNFKPCPRDKFQDQSYLSDNALDYKELLAIEQAEKAKPKKMTLNDETEGNPLAGILSKGAGLLVNKLFKKEKLTFLEYDSDPAEDLEIIPEYLKNREIFRDDLEDHQWFAKNPIRSFPFRQGQLRGDKQSLFGGDSIGEISDIAYLKFIRLQETKKTPIYKKIELLTQIMSKSKVYLGRLYIYKGVKIQPLSTSDLPDPYILLKFGKNEKNYKEQTKKAATTDPEFYVYYDYQMKLPGSNTLRIEIWNDTLGLDELIGFTEIDCENRYFNNKWCASYKKPIEQRSIRPEFSNVVVGRLELLFELYDTKNYPIFDIIPQPQQEFELRVVVWETKECAFKDEAEKCNDLFVRGGIRAKSEEFQETDTHWRCRAKGSFNWRWKFKMMLPLKQDELGMDQFVVQLWDKDIAAANDLVGEIVLDLNQHKMIQKAVKRETAVKMKKLIKEKDGQVTDKIWFDVFHPEVVDKNDNKITQGKVLLSFELMPIEEVKNFQNGSGRDPPNNFPYLPEPTGRLSFNLLDPCGFIKDIIGPDLYRKMWCIICCMIFIVVGGYLGFQFLSQYIALKIASI